MKEKILTEGELNMQNSINGSFTNRVVLWVDHKFICMLKIKVYLPYRMKDISDKKALKIFRSSIIETKLYLENYQDSVSYVVDLTKFTFSEINTVNNLEYVLDKPDNLHLCDGYVQLPDNYSLKEGKSAFMYSFEGYLTKDFFPSETPTLGEYMDTFIDFLGMARKTNKFVTDRFPEIGTSVLFAPYTIGD